MDDHPDPKTALIQLQAELQNKVQAELDAGRTPDPELLRQLQSLDQDIRAALAADEQQDDLVTRLNERTQELDARFSADHPYLSSTLRAVMDTLGKMGI